MKANELRIGNLVSIQKTALHADGSNHLKAVFEIEELRKDTAHFKGFHSGEHYKDLKPIPITEERLLDFGFYKTKRNLGSIILYEKECVKIAKVGEAWQLWMGIFDSINPPQFVHELQNYFYSHVGEELKTTEL